MPSEAPMDTTAAVSGPGSSFRRGDLSPWLWLGFPLATLAGVVLTARLAPGVYAGLLSEEQGLVELGTPAVLVMGAFWALRALVHAPVRDRFLVRWWLGFYAFCVVYFAGEELSWGQHLFGWETPEGFRYINRQTETNLHNVSPWLNQQPKWALRMGALVGGILAPLGFAIGDGLRGGGAVPWSFWRWIWPTWACAPAAALAWITATMDRMDHRDLPLGLGDVLLFSDVEEFWLALFLMLYAGSLAVRLRAAESPPQPSPS